MNIDNNNIFYSSPVAANQVGQRLDKFLCEEMPDISRSQLQRLIAEGNVCVDETIITNKNFKTKLEDVYVVTIPPPAEADPIAENIALDVVYEDDWIIVVNKPAGMTVHPAPGAYSGTLVNALLYHCKDNLSGIGGVKRPGIVHRIDKDTSGLLVVAKNDLAHKSLSEQFFDHSIERTYYAISYSVPNPLKGKIEKNIARSKFNRKKMAIVEMGGKHAVTHYECVASIGKAVSLIKCNLETGRTHQIRVHLSSLGCNLVGDLTYEKSGKSQINGVNTEVKLYINKFSRQALHAKTLGFVHPKTAEFVRFESEFPQDFCELANMAGLPIDV